LILFDPQLLAENADSKDQIRETIKNITGVDVTFAIKNFEIDYRNWDIKRCVDAILPDNLSFTGHTQAGHIVHVNLREELLPYRFVLGEILLDKIKSAK
jgi:tRNA (guanine37-N1)-methyltransferase